MLQFYFKTFRIYRRRQYRLSVISFVSHAARGLTDNTQEKKILHNDLFSSKTNISHVNGIFWGFMLKMTTNLNPSFTPVFPFVFCELKQRMCESEKKSLTLTSWFLMKKTQKSQIRVRRRYCSDLLEFLLCVSGAEEDSIDKGEGETINISKYDRHKSWHICLSHIEIVQQMK